MQKVLILGSGALQIGQAGEFDYSGSQAVKAIKEEGIKVVLVNPNIATIQTSKGLADKVYFLPITAEFVEKVIEKERPDGIMLTFGGQSALNCGLELEKKGILNKFNLRVLGSSLKTIRITEDRGLFRNKMNELNLAVPESHTVSNLKEIDKLTPKIKYPVMLRSAYALGGLGSAVVFNKKDFKEKLKIALSQSPQVLIEEYLGGWKEIEYEVVRDKYGNKVTVCNMENMDPMGIHTGESVVIAPSQTLTNSEYFALRRVSLQCIEGLNIIGECNIQFAVNPEKFEYRIIEVNARLSRSSALASKATGYPLAAVAAKLGLGFKLYEIKNAVTKSTTAFYEPALDYLVVKVPRWDLAKFIRVDEAIGSEMKSVGEVMAIGRSFPEAIQKAARMLDLNYLGIIPRRLTKIDYKNKLSKPTPERPFIIMKALIEGLSIDKIYELTRIDRWFLYQFKKIADCYRKFLKQKKLPKKLLLEAKKLGFSDAMIGYLLDQPENFVRNFRIKNNIRPYVKRIDTLAGEFPAKTNYLYLTYHADRDDYDLIETVRQKKAGILGSGPYRIGSSVEFDWCAVNTVWEFNKHNYQTIMINCNPETVSTDYDVSGKLYFEELTFERVLDIVDFEKMPLVISMGGQTANNLAMRLKEARIKILGTLPKYINQAEDRHKFSSLLDKIAIKQPLWFRVQNSRQAFIKARLLSFPVLLRPSYVLSGEAMSVIFSEHELKDYLRLNKKRAIGYPLTMTKYYEDAIEVDIDGVACDGNLIECAFLEHVEFAGVHSGDATLVYPPYCLTRENQLALFEQTKKIVRKLKISGPFNIQYLVKDDEILVIECNLRCSRSFPFSSKATGINLIELAVNCLIGNKIKSLMKKEELTMSAKARFTAVKAPQFSFSRLRGADPVLKVEMSSTGEVACFGSNLHEAYLKAILSTGVKLPQKAVLLSLGGYHTKREFLPFGHLLNKLGFKLYGTKDTAAYLNDNGLNVTRLYKIYEGGKPDVRSAITEELVDLVINTSEKPDVGLSRFLKQTSDGYLIRRAAVDYGIHLITNLESAKLFVEALAYMQNRHFEIKPWDSYVKI